MHEAYKDLGRAPKEIVLKYEIWARLIETHGVSILRDFKGYHDEKLTGLDCRSSRLNKKWRVIYQMKWGDALEIVEIWRITAHDYRL